MSRPIVVMGVSGAGKSTLARGIAAALGYRFVEGDDCHPPANVAKMSAGIPLTDEDRAPFLLNVAAAIGAVPGTRAVASCSALRRGYRDLLRERCGDVLFVLPLVDRATLHDRMAARAHFMPTALLQSQLATLELPGADERALVLDARRPIADLIDEAVAAITADGGAYAGNEERRDGN